MTRESDLLESTRAMVESTPEFRSGTPVIRGTRVPVNDVGGWVKADVLMHEILEHSPSLNIEQVRLSRIYADAYPAPAPSSHGSRPPNAEVIVDSALAGGMICRC